MAHVDLKQAGSEQPGSNRQQQSEQRHSGQQGSGAQGADTTQRNQNIPSPRGAQPLQQSSFYNDPFQMFQQLSEQMDDMFESFFSSGRPARRGMRQHGLPALWAPDVDIREEGNQLRVAIDLPGIPKDAVKIDIHDGSLIVQGERSEESRDEDKDQGFRRTERRYGSFYRTIPLPEGADTGKANASMKEGVLEITIPLPDRKQPRRLEIQG